MTSKASQCLLCALLSPNRGFLQSKHLFSLSSFLTTDEMLLLLKVNYTITCLTCGNNIPCTSLMITMRYILLTPFSDGRGIISSDVN